MKKIYFLLFFVAFLAVNAKAQVTIGSEDAPEDGAVLELKSSNLGFLLPRVPLQGLSSAAPLPSHVRGMVVFNTTNSPSDTLQVGLYYDTGSKWERISTATPITTDKWFYMPSIAIETSSPNPSETVDLYQSFVDQFANPTAKSDPNAPNLLIAIPKATDLYYYVLGYDPDVFSNISITADGKMTYSIIGPATDATFLNIVFVEK